MTNTYALRAPIYLTGGMFGCAFIEDAPSDERKRSIDFHVASDDYFGTIATVLGLVADSLPSEVTTSKKNLIDMRDELVYLQESFTIRRK